MYTLYCKYPGCKTRNLRQPSPHNKQMHGFPKDARVLKKWAEICQLPKVLGSYCICADHFHPEYSFSKGKLLLPNALPLSKDVIDRLNSGTFTQNDIRLIFLDDSNEQTEDVYRWCLIPKCKNTQIDTPETHFFEIPAETVAKREYLKSVGLDPDKFSPGPLHVCQLHFDVKTDLLNYDDWVKKKATPKLKPGVVPHKFLNEQPKITVQPWTAPENGKIETTAPPVVLSAPTEVEIKEEPLEPDYEVYLTDAPDLSNFMVFCEEEIKSEIVELQTQTIEKQHNYAAEHYSQIQNYTKDLCEKLKNLSCQNRLKIIREIDRLLYLAKREDAIK